MKKQLFSTLLISLIMAPTMYLQADVDGQSTEGKDFWVTFMQADQRTSSDGDWDGSYNTLKLSLSISAREDCQVVVSNPYTSYKDTFDVQANVMLPVDIYAGTPLTYDARNAMDGTGKVCYAVNSEQVDTCAIHVTATKNISLFATNYKKATFDATNVLPTASLLTEYVIQTYSPSDHGGTAQGSHFAIIATEDSTVVSYILSENTMMHYKGDTVVTDTLKAGQVWYVWTGSGDDAPYDLSGTHIYSNKNIAVFQGCPHTNIPNKVKERDHIFSQAMPTKYWGNTFVLTTSSGRHKDYVRILALNDETTVYINGDSVYTFDFANNPKQFWEFTIGDQGTYAKNGSCIVTTSCPCATHLFLASKKDDNVENGDPAMLWVNPIEQQIDQVTFATYSSSNGTTAHYVNVVTDQPDLMTITGGSSPAMSFKPVSGSSKYHYAQVSLGSQATSYTLKSNGSNFIAHVYGFTKNESYGYSAGGATKPLKQSIYINGEEFSSDKENNLCGRDTIHFACKPDYEIEKIVWHFGDGSADVTITDTSVVVPHFYTETKDYDATCSIYRNSSNLCYGQSAVDIIPIKVTTGRYEFSIGQADIPCPVNGVQGPGKIPYTSTIDLTGNHVSVDFDDAAKAANFTMNNLSIKPGYFELSLDGTKAEPGVPYGIKISIESDCGDTIATLPFQLPVGNDVVTQRYSNVLGLIKDHPQLKGLALSDFQWFRVAGNDTTQLDGQVSSNLNMYDLSEDSYKDAEFYVCYWINKGLADQRYTCACAKPFGNDTTKHEFDNDPDKLIISANYDFKENKIFVNANWGGKTDIECYAQWINASGRVYNDMKFNIPDGGCAIPTPNENGLYLLRVVTGKKTRSFKFIINK